MEIMEVIDPVTFESWIAKRFPSGGVLDGGTESITLQKLMANAVTDPQVTILSRAVSETGIDEIQARMTLAIMQVFLQTELRAGGRNEQAR
jgi:hypothetical protein